MDGNAVNQVRQTQIYKDFDIAFYKVDKASIKGVALGPTEGWGMGPERMLFDGVILDGFSEDRKVSSDVLIRDPIQIVNSNF